MSTRLHLQHFVEARFASVEASVFERPGSEQANPIFSDHGTPDANGLRRAGVERSAAAYPKANPPQELLFNEYTIVAGTTAGPRDAIERICKEDCDYILSSLLADLVRAG